MCHKNSWKIAFTYVGAIVGAGFATGQEIYQFFTVFRVDGIKGNIVATLGFAIFGVLYLSLVYNQPVNSYDDLLKILVGTKLAKVFDIAISFFLFGSFTIMLAAAQSLIYTHVIDNITISYIIVITVLWLSFTKGVKGIININTYLIPILLLIVVILCMGNLSNATETFGGRGLIPQNYLFSSLTYVSYNLIIGMVVLSSLKEEIYKKSTIFFAPLLAGIMMGLMLVLITTATMSIDNPGEIPILDLAEEHSKYFYWPLISGIGIAILTSALASGYGLINRVDQSIDIGYSGIVGLITFLAIPLSLMGFTSLIKYIYPFFGFVNLIVMMMVIRYFIMGKKRKKFYNNS